jgi:hypothetical protein
VTELADTTKPNRFTGFVDLDCQDRTTDPHKCSATMQGSWFGKGSIVPCCADGDGDICYYYNGGNLKMVKVDADSKQIGQGYVGSVVDTSCDTVRQSYAKKTDVGKANYYVTDVQCKGYCSAKMHGSWFGKETVVPCCADGDDSVCYYYNGGSVLKMVKVDAKGKQTGQGNIASSDTSCDAVVKSFGSKTSVGKDNYYVDNFKCYRSLEAAKKDCGIFGLGLKLGCGLLIDTARNVGHGAGNLLGNLFEEEQEFADEEEELADELASLLRKLQEERQQKQEEERLADLLSLFKKL